MFVCRWYLMTFDAFMDWLETWKHMGIYDEEDKRFHIWVTLELTTEADALLVDSQTLDGSHCAKPLTIIMLKWGPQCSHCVAEKNKTAMTDHSFTWGEGLKRVVFSRDGISTLIQSLNMRSVLWPNHKTGHQHISQHARAVFVSASQAMSDPKGTEARDTQQLVCWGKVGQKHKRDQMSPHDTGSTESC